MAFCLADGEEGYRDQADARGTQVAEVPDKTTQKEKHPGPVQQGASRGLTATAACLAALLIVSAAIANSLPNFDGLSLPNFEHFTFPKFDSLSFFHFNRTASPKSSRIAGTPSHEAAKPPPERISVPIPDPAALAALKEIRSTQDQNTVVLASLAQSSASQQADLKRISRQLSALSVQVEALTPPLTTSSIPRPPATSAIPRSHARARIIRSSRRAEPKTEPALPPPVGPVSVGGAPLSPAPVPAPVSVSVSSAK